jgi:hypothetical protein
MMNQGRDRVREQIRLSYYSAFIRIKNSIEEPNYSNLINQFINGNYTELATAISKDELNNLKENYKQIKADHYKEFVFLELSIGVAQLSTYIEQLLMGNTSSLSLALAIYKTDMIKSEFRAELQKQEKLEAKFLEMHFEEGIKETKAQKYFVPSVYYGTGNRRIYGGVNAFAVFNKTRQLSQDLQSPFKSFKESAIRNAEDFVFKQNFISPMYTNSYSTLRSLEQDIRKAKSDLFWMELKEENERNRFYFNKHQNQFHYNMGTLNPQNISFFHTNPFAVHRLKNDLQRNIQDLTIYSQQSKSQPYFSSQNIFSNLYNTIESYAKATPSSHLDAVGRGLTHATLDIASLIAHPLDNMVYPISDLVYDATVIAAHHNFLYSKDPDVEFLRNHLDDNPTSYHEATKRMKLRGDNISTIINFYLNASPEECTKEITRVLAPGYILKAAKTLSVLKPNLTTVAKTQSDFFSQINKTKTPGNSQAFSLAMEEPAFPLGSLSAAQAWTMKNRLKTAGLPTKGKVRYVPPEGYDPTVRLPKKGKTCGYLDRHGNEWVKGPSRILGESFEWDVRLSSMGYSHYKDFAHINGSCYYINVSPKGHITH